jgi:hypothetical protein
MDYKRLSSNDTKYSTHQTTDSYADNTDNTYNKRHSTRKYNNIMIGVVVAISLSMCAIGLSSTAYNKYTGLEHRVDTLSSDYTSGTSNNMMASRILQVQQGVNAMFTGHPMCSSNYSECMNLMHIASHISSHNISVSSVVNGDFNLGSSDVVVLGSNGDVMGHGSSLDGVDRASLNMLHHELPAPEDCHHYAYGTCLFTHNDHLMFYSHIMFDSGSGIDGHSDIDLRRSMDDLFSYGASGAGMGSAIGGGLAVIAGPEAIPVGAAVGGAIGAVVGGTIGAFQ